MDILLIGLSHKTAPLEIREQLSLPSTILRSALTHFDGIHKQAHLEAVREGVILSTCNRLEVYGLVGDPQVAKEAIIEFLSQACDIPSRAFSGFLYTYHNEEAVRHLMRVASGLDSLVVGETQILGQVKEAYEAALSQRAAGTVLSTLFKAAIHAGKRARSDTGIGENSASVSSVAINLANEVLNNELPQQKVLLIGAGEMGVIAVKALKKRGVSSIMVANRTFEGAEQLAKTIAGEAISFQQLPQALISSDIVITATGAPHTIIDRAQLEPVMTCRHGRPLFIIDIAVPRDVDPDVMEIPDVILRNMDDLQSQADKNVRERQSEIPRVEMIVDEEVNQFLEWFSSLEAVKTITDLRRQVEQVRQLELNRLFDRLNLDERERDLVTTMSHRLVNKILHEPTMCLKKETANGNGTAYITTTRHLFSLDKGVSHD
jgi:glutamyl-tRNA reductase